MSSFILNSVSSLNKEVKNNENNIIRDIGYENTLTAKISKQNEFDSGDYGIEFVRVNFNTCVKKDKYCDHIFDILNMYKDKSNKNPIHFKKLKIKLLFRNIFVSSWENITRIHRLILDNENITRTELTDINYIRREFNNYFTSTNKIKYYQGYYRVLMIYEIIKRCDEESFNHYFEILGTIVKSYLDRFKMDYNIFATILESETEYNKKLKKFCEDIESKYIIEYKKKLEEEIDKLDISEIDRLVKEYNIRIIIPGRGRIEFDKKYLKKFKKEIVTKKYLKGVVYNYANKKEVIKAFKFLLDFWKISDRVLL